MSQEGSSQLEDQLSQCLGTNRSLSMIKTFVFMKTKTTGIYQGPEPYKNFDALTQEASPAVFQQELLNYMNRCDLNQLPRLTALALLSVPRGTFINAMNCMQKSFMEEKPSIETPTPANILHFVMNPEVSEEEQGQSQKSPLRYSQTQNRRLNCHLNQTFAEQWPVIAAFLTTLPKPLCLVGHYAQYFDFPILLGELKRAGVQELPEGIFFADSYFAAKSMEQTFMSGLHNHLQYFGGSQPHEHPWNLMKQGKIAPAFLRQFPMGDFGLQNGQWKPMTDLKADGRYRLPKLYSQIFVNKQNKFEYALPASEAILQLCLSYGSSFLNYIDSTAAELPRPT